MSSFFSDPFPFFLSSSYAQSVHLAPNTAPTALLTLTHWNQTVELSPGPTLNPLPKEALSPDPYTIKMLYTILILPSTPTCVHILSSVLTESDRERTQNLTLV